MPDNNINEKSGKGFLLHFVHLTVFYLKRKHLKKYANQLHILVVLFLYFVYHYYCLTTQVVIKVINNNIREKAWFLKFRKQLYQFISLTDSFVLVQLPVNLKLPTASLFQKNDYYLWNPLKVKELENIFLYLTQDTGIVLKQTGVYQNSIHGWWDKRQIEVQKPYHKWTIEAFLANKYSANHNELCLDKKQYILVHHWFNYYHWLTESVLRLWMIKDLKNKTLILPASLKSFSYVSDSLTAFDNIDVLYVEKGKFPFVKSLLVVENKQYCDHYPPQMMIDIGRFFVRHAERVGTDTNYGERIFISRKNAPRRNIVNEAEVEKLLSQFGFNSVIIENHSFFEQVALMSKAKYLISMHGAGLTNMMFMPVGSHVLEFYMEIRNSQEDHHSVVYWKLASAMRHHYYYQFCTTEYQNSNFLTANLKIDIEKLRKNVELMLSS